MAILKDWQVQSAEAWRNEALRRRGKKDHKDKAQTGRRSSVHRAGEPSQDHARLWRFVLYYILQEVIERASVDEEVIKLPWRQGGEKWRKSQCKNPPRGYCSSSGKRGRGFDLRVCKILKDGFVLITLGW